MPRSVSTVERTNSWNPSVLPPAHVRYSHVKTDSQVSYSHEEQLALAPAVEYQNSSTNYVTQRTHSARQSIQSVASNEVEDYILPETFTNEHRLSDRSSRHSARFSALTSSTVSAAQIQSAEVLTSSPPSRHNSQNANPHFSMYAPSFSSTIVNDSAPQLPATEPTAPFLDSQDIQRIAASSTTRNSIPEHVAADSPTIASFFQPVSAQSSVTNNGEVPPVAGLANFMHRGNGAEHSDAATTTSRMSSAPPSYKTRSILSLCVQLTNADIAQDDDGDWPCP